jgi:hypothetical protein
VESEDSSHGFDLDAPGGLYLIVDPRRSQVIRSQLEETTQILTAPPKVDAMKERASAPVLRA